jgi:hypothetical protein
MVGGEAFPAQNNGALPAKHFNPYDHQSPQTRVMTMSPGMPPGKSTIWYLMR